MQEIPRNTRSGSGCARSATGERERERDIYIYIHTYIHTLHAEGTTSASCKAIIYLDATVFCLALAASAVRVFFTCVCTYKCDLIMRLYYRSVNHISCLALVASAVRVFCVCVCVLTCNTHMRTHKLAVLESSYVCVPLQR